MGRVPFAQVETLEIETPASRATICDRTENERFIALRTHYGFEPLFGEPGIDGAHETGGVEGDVGWFRRNHLTPSRRSTASPTSTRSSSVATPPMVSVG